MSRCYPPNGRRFRVRPKKNTPRDRGLGRLELVQVSAAGFNASVYHVQTGANIKAKHAFGELPERQHNKPANEQGARRADHYQSHIL